MSGHVYKVQTKDKNRGAASTRCINLAKDVLGT